MRYIDMHIHTTASDGSCTPEEVCQKVIEKGLAAFAITDHDTVDGIVPAIKYMQKIHMPHDNSAGDEISAPDLIPGIELSAMYRGREIHILGYYIDYTNPGFLDILDKIKNDRIKRNMAMCELFQREGIDMTMEKLAHGNPGSVITRAHFARVLLEDGVVKNKDQAFKKYLGEGCRCYIKKEEIPCEYAMEALNKYSKGAFLAHPMLYKYGYREITELIEYLIPLGLKGIEAYHPSNNGYGGRLREIAADHDLLVSGGSDFHGYIKPDIDIGSGRGSLRITESVYQNIKKSLCPDDIL